MDKFSELSNPVAWTDAEELRDLSKHRCAYMFIIDSANPYHDPRRQQMLYSQEYVSALQHESAVNWEAAASLNVENQELKKRIAELERANKSQDDHINQQQDRIESLEKKNGDLGQSLGAAEKRLATPVRLPGSFYPDGDIDCPLAVELDEAVEAIRAAGFEVEGGEQNG